MQNLIILVHQTITKIHFQKLEFQIWEEQKIQINKSKLIRRIIQSNTNDGSKSNRKSYSPRKNETNISTTSSKNNIANSIIMRRQLNAIKDLSPPKNKFGYAFMYDDPHTTKAHQGFERKILQQIAKSKPRINQPSPNKKIRKYVNNKVSNNNSIGLRDISFNSTVKFNHSKGTILIYIAFNRYE